MNVQHADTSCLTLYLLVLVVAGWLLMRVLLYVTWCRALRSVGTGYGTVLLTQVPTTGTCRWPHKLAVDVEEHKTESRQTNTTKEKLY